MTSDNVVRLQYIKTLLSDCIFRAEEAEIDYRKFKVIKNFLFYNSQKHFILEPEACDTVISNYAVAGSRRLRANTAQVFVDRITQIGKEALPEAEGANAGMKECPFGIMVEAKRLVGEIQRAKKEAGYLGELEARAADLRIVLKAYDPKIERRYNAETGQYNSSES
ncbi:hypothetical protein F5Y09DRAFT_342522 [Xylaria sp. FL1042]|nr:hypothetical protein F5Y09DRAFT_342522 [Xylaria sp. FL1042]